MYHSTIQHHPKFQHHLTNSIGHEKYISSYCIMPFNDIVHLLPAIYTLEYMVLQNILTLLFIVFTFCKVRLSDVRGPPATRFHRSIFLLIRDIDRSR